MVNAGFAATVAARSACIINSREFIVASHCRKVFVGSVDTKSSSHVSQLKSTGTIKRDIHVSRVWEKCCGRRGQFLNPKSVGFIFRQHPVTASTSFVSTLYNTHACRFLNLKSVCTPVLVAIACNPNTKHRSRFTNLKSVGTLTANLTMADNRYCIEYAKTGRSGCKKCKTQIEKGVTRVGKITPNPFSDDGGEMKVWYHTRCMFETLKRARTAKKIETPADIEGFPEMKDEEKDEIRKLIAEFEAAKPAAKSPAKAGKAGKTGKTGSKASKGGASGTTQLFGSPAPKPSSGESPSKRMTSTSAATSSTAAVAGDSPSGATGSDLTDGASTSQDNRFSEFRKVCQHLENESSYNAKTKVVANFIKRGSSGDGYTGDVYILVKLLLPTSGKKRVYNLQSKQIVKLLSQIFSCCWDDMVEDLEKGDVAETAKTFFLKSTRLPPCSTSTLTLAQVDSFLDRMTVVTKEEDQKTELSKIIKKCTADDLKYIIRLIKHDLRINSGPKHILDALDPNAYAAFQASHDLRDVVDRVLGADGGGEEGGRKPGMKKMLSVRASLMTPVKPMLAEACRSTAMAMKKCPNGMYAEIKYDGERVQVHKQGDEFVFYSRSLKPVQSHKVEHIKDYMTKACPHGDSMILDCEVLMVDNKTGKPLPFGTLGVHKRNAFQDATCCLYIFDILYFNGETLMAKPMCERRKILEKNIAEVRNRIHLGEQTHIKHESDLGDLMMKAIKQGLEGLVLKDTKSVYEPGKRHWLKMKKDYLAGGAMADTADLIVLGAYYGTGNKGGMMSVFLMGVYDKSCDRFRTVAKCGNGHDDATITRLQHELDMVKISKDPSKVPAWLLINKSVIPDFVVKNPKVAPVWEITGAEFSKSTAHTADGISVRFPRVTRIRDDKDWTNATDLDRLKTLFIASKETTDIPGWMGEASGGGGEVKEEENGEGEGETEEEEDEVRETGTSKSKSPMKTLTKSPAKAPAKSPKKTLTKSPAKAPAKSPKKIVTYSPAKAPAGSKRVRDVGDSSESPAAKRGKNTVCKYGPKCFQTSAKHKEAFDHPWDNLGTHQCAGITISQPLADLFTGVKVYIDPCVIKADQLRRYFIAYDGEVVDEYQKSQATYHITEAGASSEVSAPSVKPDWVWDCLQQKALLPVSTYTH